MSDINKERRREDPRFGSIENRVRDVELDMANRLTSLEGKIGGINDLLKEFVTNARFTPVQVLVYGLVSLVMTSVFAMLIAKVLVK